MDFALLLFLTLNLIFQYPLYLAIFTLIGALVPDIDIKTRGLHRKLMHNIWVLMIILAILFRLGLADQKVAILFSIGFLSHLITDAMTIKGIQPLWPIKWPHFRGDITTGGLKEYFILIALFVIAVFVASKA